MAENAITNTAGNVLAVRTSTADVTPQLSLRASYSGNAKRVRGKKKLGELTVGDLEEKVQVLFGDVPLIFRQSSWRESVIGEGEGRIVIQPMIGITYGVDWIAESMQRKDNLGYIDISVTGKYNDKSLRRVGLEGLPRNYSLADALEELKGYSGAGEPRVFWKEKRASTTADIQSSTTA